MTMMNEIDLLNDKMMSLAEIVAFTGLSDKWFYKLISQGKFPKPIKLGSCSRWLQSEVIEWLNNRVTESRDK